MKKALIFAFATAFCGVWGATISVVAPQDDAAKAVTVGGGAAMTCDAGTAVPLKATANDGWVFAGWYGAYDEATSVFSNEVVLAQSVDWRTPAANYVVGDGDVTLYARFVKPKDDTLSFDLAEVFANAAYDTDAADRPILSLTNGIDEVVVFNSLSLPTVSISGLPSGLSFDGKTMKLTGTPQSPGLYRITASAKNVSGFTFSQIFYVRVENKASALVSGSDDNDVTVGDEVDEYLDNYFYIDGDYKSVSVSGLPTGLSLVSDDDVYSVQGTATKSGDYLVTCTVTFTDNHVESATMLFTVNEPSPFDYDGNVDFSTLEGYSTGDVILADDLVVLGEYYNEYKTGVTAVSGLPPGITAVKTPNEDGSSYVLKGVFSKAGEYTVSVKVAYEDWESESVATVTLNYKIIVGDRPGIYLSAEVCFRRDSQANGNGRQGICVRGMVR